MAMAAAEAGSFFIAAAARLKACPDTNLYIYAGETRCDGCHVERRMSPLRGRIGKKRGFVSRVSYQGMPSGMPQAAVLRDPAAEAAYFLGAFAVRLKPYPDTNLYTNRDKNLSSKLSSRGLSRKPRFDLY
jgi:hypothetical protein